MELLQVLQVRRFSVLPSSTTTTSSTSSSTTTVVQSRQGSNDYTDHCGDQHNATTNIVATTNNGATTNIVATTSIGATTNTVATTNVVANYHNRCDLRHHATTRNTTTTTKQLTPLQTLTSKFQSGTYQPEQVQQDRLLPDRQGVHQGTPTGLRPPTTHKSVTTPRRTTT